MFRAIERNGLKGDFLWSVHTWPCLARLNTELIRGRLGDSSFLVTVTVAGFLVLIESTRTFF